MTSPYMQTLFLSLFCFAYSCNAMDTAQYNKQNATESEESCDTLLEQHTSCRHILEYYKDSAQVTIRDLHKCGIIMPWSVYFEEEEFYGDNQPVSSLKKLKTIIALQKNELRKKILDL